MVKLIASDLDGTLLKNGAQELNTTVFQQILALRENGIYFVAASGRQYENLRRLFAPVKDDISYIAENGSLCIHKDPLGVCPGDGASLFAVSMIDVDASTHADEDVVKETIGQIGPSFGLCFGRFGGTLGRNISCH